MLIRKSYNMLILIPRRVHFLVSWPRSTNRFDCFILSFSHTAELKLIFGHSQIFRRSQNIIIFTAVEMCYESVLSCYAGYFVCETAAELFLLIWLHCINISHLCLPTDMFYYCHRLITLCCNICVFSSVAEETWINLKKILKMKNLKPGKKKNRRLL